MVGDFDIKFGFDISDGGSVTWYEPLPVETISDHNVDHTANKVQALEGFPKELSWNFSFTSDLSFNSLTIALDGTNVAAAQSSGAAGIQSGFTERFNFSWIPTQEFTLVIFNVTADDNATFTCVLTLAEGIFSNPWESRIQVNVVGKLGFIVNLVICSVILPCTSYLFQSIKLHVLQGEVQGWHNGECTCLPPNVVHWA